MTNVATCGHTGKIGGGLQTKVPMASGVSPNYASPAMVTVTDGCSSSEPWIPIKEKQAQDMWTPKEPEPLHKGLG